MNTRVERGIFALNGSEDEGARDRVLSGLFAHVGLDYARFSEALRERLLLSAAEQRTLGDDFECAAYADDVAAADAEGGKDGMTPEDWLVVKGASAITDIGKTGPLGATPDQRTLIARIYAINTKEAGGVDALTLPEFLALSPALRNDLPRRLDMLESMGVPPTSSMRPFFNRHAQWTEELLRNESAIPDEVRVVASLHHLLEGVNPGGLVDMSDARLWIPSLNRAVGEKEAWVILLDKYQASRGRGGNSHADAMRWLRGFVDGPGVKLVPYPESFKRTLTDCLDRLDRALSVPSVRSDAGSYAEAK